MGRKPRSGPQNLQLGSIKGKKEAVRIPAQTQAIKGRGEEGRRASFGRRGAAGRQNARRKGRGMKRPD